MSDLRICRQSAIVVLDGNQHHIRRARTLAHADHPIVTSRPELWRELKVDFPAPDAVAEPVTEPDPAPSAAKVRQWAKTQGLDVPARGPMPDDVVAAYLAAQG